MLYEFAMTPELFGAPFATADKRTEVVLPQLLCRIAENGLLANLNKDRWLRHVRERLATLSESSPMLKGDILKCLNVLHDRHRLVRHPKSKSGNLDTDQDWLNLAFESHEKIPFDAIILSKELMENSGRDCDALVDVFDSLYLPLWGKRTLSLTKTESEYRSVLRPVLRHARTLSLIDPYMNTTPRFFRTVELCSELLGKGVHDERREGRIRIHAQAPYDKEEVRTCLDSWGEKLSPLRDKHGHRFEVYLWETDSKPMHDRFILTDQCGISIPGGLDCRGGKKTNCILLDDSDRREWKQYYDPDYDPDTKPFKLIKD